MRERRGGRLYLLRLDDTRPDFFRLRLDLSLGRDRLLRLLERIEYAQERIRVDERIRVLLLVVLRLSFFLGSIGRVIRAGVVAGVVGKRIEGILRLIRHLRAQRRGLLFDLTPAVQREMCHRHGIVRGGIHRGRSAHGESELVSALSDEESEKAKTLW